MLLIAKEKKIPRIRPKLRKKEKKNQHLKTLIEIFKYNENELKKLKEQNNLKDVFK